MARPLGFDPDAAVSALKAVFWTRGFEATSMQDIEAATGLAKQSMYRLFGDKRGMYRAALQSYAACEVASGAELVADTPGDARARLAALFADAIAETVVTGDLRGCFLCNATAEVAIDDHDTQALLRQMADQLTQVFVAALRVDPIYAGDDVLTARRALHLHAGYVGLRVLVKSGLTVAEAEALVEDLLACVMPRGVPVV
jgi:TetR/AcrR family transcriptional regulator, transcriptional repressor for nem operon